MTAPPLDIGILLAEAAKATALDGIDGFRLTRPELVMTTAGAGIPIADGCDGMLWVRVDTVYPTRGDADPLGVARIDFDLPAWAFPIHVGFLWCHDVIDELGYAPDAGSLTEAAHRDAQYRAAVYTGLVEQFPGVVSSQGLGYGWRFSPWMPYGPEGGVSGGSVLITVLSNYLVLQPDSADQTGGT